MTDHDTLVTLSLRGAGSCPPQIGQTTNLSIQVDNENWSHEAGCRSWECLYQYSFGVACYPIGSHVFGLAVQCEKPSTSVPNGCDQDNGVVYTNFQINRFAQPSGTTVLSQYISPAGQAFVDLTSKIAWNNQYPQFVQVHYFQLPERNFAGDDANIPGIQEDGTKTVSVGTYPETRLIRVTAVACDKWGSEVIAIKDHECCDCKGSPATCVGSPIRVSTGNMRYSDRDPLPLLPGGLARVYDSSESANGFFGRGWYSILDAWLRRVDDGNGQSTIVVGTPDNHRYVFSGAGAQFRQLWPKSSTPASFMAVGSAYVLREYGSDTQLWFGSTGFLARTHSISSGREFTFQYANNLPVSVTDSWGNGSWTINPDVNTGLITSIATGDGSGTAWNYVYDSSRKLTSVNVNGATWRTYVYSGNQMAEAHDAAGNLIEAHSYAPTGEATTSVGGTDEVAAIDYNGAGRVPGETVTTVTSTAGAVTRYYTRYLAGRARTVQVEGACFSCGTKDAVYAYDAGGNLVLEQNARGYLTSRTFDDQGRETSVSGPWRPASCDPATDPDRCRLTPDTIGSTLLQSTGETITKTSAYSDSNWPDRPTQTTVTSVTGASHVRTETLTYDAVTGQMLTDTVTGWGSDPNTPESHTTTIALYDGTEGAAFDPGGAFDPSWLGVAQPSGMRKSVDGPRTDVSDVTALVYYPFAGSVPEPWRGHLAATRNAAGHITRFENYDGFGNPARVVDANGVATEATYDVLGRVLTTTLKGASGCNTAADPLCATDLTSTRIYTPLAGPLTSDQRPNGSVTAYEYDSRGRLAALSRGPAANDLRERIETSYDPASGQKSQERTYARENGTWAEKRRESYTYDSFARLTNTTHADNATVAYTYDPASAIASVKDENHTSPNTSYAYDTAQRLTGVTQTLATAAGGQVTTHYAYDIQGNLASVADPNGNVTTYVYDDFGRMLSQTSPVTGTTTYSYDAAGNLVSTTDANGATTTRTYDALNRVLTAASSRSGASTESIAYTYDAQGGGTFGIGRLGAMSDPSGSAAYTYERRGLLAAEQKTIGTASFTSTYGYDADGNRATIGYPSGRSVAYAFDFADRPYGASSGSTVFVGSASYLPFGPMTQLVYGNGTTKTMQYDARYRPLENKLASAAGSLADYTYQEDAVGNITQIHDAVDPGYNRDFGYDDLNRLVTANSGASLWGSGSYQYDAMGNMTALSLGSGRSSAFSYSGSLPKLTGVVENGVNRALAYDAAGNENTVGSLGFSYSARNQLLSADALEYAYDGRGVRVSTSYPGYALSSVSIAPSTLYTNQSATGTVTLGAPAPAGGAVVALSSSNPAITIPATVTVPAGGVTAAFSVGQAAGAGAASVTITARLVFERTATVSTASGPPIASVAVTPSSVTGGTSSQATVTLTGVAPPGGAPVSLSSTVPAAASVPSSVTVPAGSASTTVPITTTPVTTTTSATINASYNGTATAPFTVAAPQLTAFALSPSSVSGGHSATGTLTLDGPAAVNTDVALTNGNTAAATVPPAVTVAAGSISQTFNVATATSVSSTTTAPLSATAAGIVKNATLTVTPCVPDTSPQPSMPGGDTVWIDDVLPAGASLSSMQWDTTQSASGTKSLGRVYVGNASYASGILGLNQAVAIGENAVVYLKINECAPPADLRITWETPIKNAQAYWGPSASGAGPYATYLGTLPGTAAWTRLEIPLRQLGIEQTTVTRMDITYNNGQLWLDHIGKSGVACVPATSPQPSMPSGDTVWIDDALPAGASLSSMQWDTTQAASGTKSVGRAYLGNANYASGILGLNQAVAIGENAVVYVKLNECAPPADLRITWETPIKNAQAYWGPSASAAGPYAFYAGTLPVASGGWTRLEIPLSRLGIEQTTVTRIDIAYTNGQIWFDHIGKSGTGCTPATALQPVMPSGDTVWIDDTLPAGASLSSMQWDSSQSASGTKSIGRAYLGNANYASGILGLNQAVAIGENAVVYVKLNECAPPADLRITWETPIKNAQAYWGPSASAAGPYAFYAGTLPVASGGWTRLEIPLSRLGIEQTTVTRIDIAYTNGQIWFDHIGKSGTGCTPATALQPVMPSGDTVWIDDTLPAGASLSSMQWDSSQSASGTKSIGRNYLGNASYASSILGLSQTLATGENAVFYVKLNECAVPNDLRVIWDTPIRNGQAYWGPSASGAGPYAIYEGPLPAQTGAWVRLEVPFHDLGVEQTTLTRIDITYTNGQLWLDRIGKTTLPAQATLTGFSMNPPSPSPAGTAITWTASAYGTVLPLQYRFEREDNGTWSVVQAYSSSNAYTWTPGAGDVGDHAVRVSVRNSGSGADLEDGRTLTITITGGSGSLRTRAKFLWARLDPRRWRSRPEPAPPVSLSVRPVVATAGGDLVRYSLYTPELSLMAETAESTSSTPPIAYEYIWFAGQPVAQVDVATNTTHWTFTDHLGTPIVRTDASATVDWRAEYEPYGTVYTYRAGASTHQPLRFPGQEYDPAATDREYNIFRWYREGWGRYTQGDPIGIVADVNLYGYVTDRPIVLLDSLGQQAQQDTGLTNDHAFQACCDKAVADKVFDTNSTPSGGLVMCCNGHKVACARQRSGAFAGNKSLELAYALALQCVLAHEEQHIIDLPLCRCGSDYPAQFAKKGERKASECSEANVEIDCLQKAKQQCNGDPTCINALQTISNKGPQGLRQQFNCK